VSRRIRAPAAGQNTLDAYRLARENRSRSVRHGGVGKTIEARDNATNVLSRMGFLRSTLICPLSGDLFE
jgi:hypothetical protein